MSHDRSSRWLWRADCTRTRRPPRSCCRAGRPRRSRTRPGPRLRQPRIHQEHGQRLPRRSSKRGSFEFSEVGINFTSQLTDRLRFGVQLFAHDLGPIGNYSAKADWYYLDYRWRDWFGFRAGRLKVPFGLYNETSDIDAARPTILLPTSVYPPTNRDYFLAQTGFEFYGFQPLRRLGAIDYRLYGGTIFIDLPNQRGAPVQIGRSRSRTSAEAGSCGRRRSTGYAWAEARRRAKIVDRSFSAIPHAAVGGPRTSERTWARIGRISSARDSCSRRSTAAAARLLTARPSGAVSRAAWGDRQRAVAMSWPPTASQLAVAGRVLLIQLPRRGQAPGPREHAARRRRRPCDSTSTHFWIVKLEGHYMHGTAGLARRRPSRRWPNWGALPHQDDGLLLSETCAAASCYSVCLGIAVGLGGGRGPFERRRLIASS